jgi:hypothetical protein
LTTNCPNCAAEVTFQSNLSVFLVCPYCRSMLVRHDLKIENLGVMADLANDTNPLQIGPTGNFKGDYFTLIGRLRRAYEDGFWDEWFTLFASGRHGWVTEAQGFYMVSFEVEEPGALPSLKELRPDHALMIQKNMYTVDDIKEVANQACQGELPFAVTPGTKGTSVDLSAPGHLFANLDYAGEEVSLFLGDYIDYPNLEVENLRPLDGW